VQRELETLFLSHFLCSMMFKNKKILKEMITGANTRLGFGVSYSNNHSCGNFQSSDSFFLLLKLFQQWLVINLCMLRQDFFSFHHKY
jgi:hypothetical protein